LLDEYNSCPGYFEDGGQGGPSGGRPDVLIRFCKPGIREEDLAAILAEEVVFAEGIVEKLADALGIDGERALSDFGDGDPEGDDDSEDDGDGDEPGSPSNDERVRALLAGRVGQMFGGPQASATVDPQVQALVDAAHRGDVAEIEKLLAAGVPIDAQAPSPLPVNEAVQAMGIEMPGGMPKMPMSPLIAALSYKQHAATKLLLKRGADCNSPHAIFGPPIHVAVGANDPELIRLLIDHGADVNALNFQRQTPLTILLMARQSYDRVAQAQTMMKSMGMKVPAVLEKLSQAKVPTDRYDACEQLLKSHGAH
jgi:hypothetical protein